MPAGTEGPIVAVSVETDSVIVKVGPSALVPRRTVAELRPDPCSPNGTVTVAVWSTRIRFGLSDTGPSTGAVKSTFTVMDFED